jgi:endonuclease/exonuclease/phosphatase family metal-dependent hydrolase
MKILYMNQGVSGHWGAIKYSEFDLILLAESNQAKQGFELKWESNALPVMSAQVKEGLRTRSISDVKDLDVLRSEVRPIATFQIKAGIQVVFVHLKSGNEKFATTALSVAVSQFISQYNQNTPTLWIGDFNRATHHPLAGLPEFKAVFEGGGKAGWALDRAYITGNWKNIRYQCTAISTSFSDHNHAAIEFEYES